MPHQNRLDDCPTDPLHRPSPPYATANRLRPTPGPGRLRCRPGPGGRSGKPTKARSCASAEAVIAKVPHGILEPPLACRPCRSTARPCASLRTRSSPSALCSCARCRTRSGSASGARSGIRRSPFAVAQESGPGTETAAPQRNPRTARDRHCLPYRAGVSAALHTYLAGGTESRRSQRLSGLVALPSHRRPCCCGPFRIPAVRPGWKPPAPPCSQPCLLVRRGRRRWRRAWAAVWRDRRCQEDPRPEW
jgi:hypothetical protein